MSSRWTNAGWALAALFAAAAALFAWQYAQARRDVRDVRRDYELLQRRVEEQAARNEPLDAALRATSRQLSEIQARVEALGCSAPPSADATP